MKLSPFILCVILASASLSADVQSLTIRTVNFKTCVDSSKFGKQEQSSFDALKKQMEGVLSEKEKGLNDMAAKFDDPDYLDSLSPEAETELKRKFRTMNQEISQLQTQYYQALQQTNFKVVQQLNEVVTKASNKLAKDEKIDLIINDEGCFFANPQFDVSQKIIKIMDELYETEGDKLFKSTEDTKDILPVTK